MVSTRTMKNLWILFIVFVVMAGTTIGINPASSQNNTNDTTAAVVNLTNASSSLGDAQNMSVIEGTTNSTK